MKVIGQEVKNKYIFTLSVYERVRTKEGEKRENGRREEGKRKIEVIEGVIESGEEF